MVASVLQTFPHGIYSSAPLPLIRHVGADIIQKHVTSSAGFDMSVDAKCGQRRVVQVSKRICESHPSGALKACCWSRLNLICNDLQVAALLDC